MRKGEGERRENRARAVAPGGKTACLAAPSCPVPLPDLATGCKSGQKCLGATGFWAISGSRAPGRGRGADRVGQSVSDFFWADTASFSGRPGGVAGWGVRGAVTPPIFPDK